MSRIHYLNTSESQFDLRALRLENEFKQFQLRPICGCVTFVECHFFQRQRTALWISIQLSCLVRMQVAANNRKCASSFLRGCCILQDSSILCINCRLSKITRGHLVTCLAVIRKKKSHRCLRRLSWARRSFVRHALWCKWACASSSPWRGRIVRSGPTPSSLCTLYNLSLRLACSAKISVHGSSGLSDSVLQVLQQHQHEFERHCHLSEPSIKQLHKQQHCAKECSTCRRQQQKPTRCGGASPPRQTSDSENSTHHTLPSSWTTLAIWRRWYSLKSPKTLARLVERNAAVPGPAPAATHIGSFVTESQLLDLIGPPRSALLCRWFNDDTRTVFALHRFLFTAHSSNCLLHLSHVSLPSAWAHLRLPSAQVHPCNSCLKAPTLVNRPDPFVSRHCARSAPQFEDDRGRVLASGPDGLADQQLLHVAAAIPNAG